MTSRTKAATIKRRFLPWKYNPDPAALLHMRAGRLSFPQIARQFGPECDHTTVMHWFTRFGLPTDPDQALAALSAQQPTQSAGVDHG